MMSVWKILKTFGLFYGLVFFTLPAQSGQKRDIFHEVLNRSEVEQRVIRKKRVLKIKGIIRQEEGPSSVQLSEDMDFQELADTGPSDPIFTDKGNDYSGLNTFRSEVELEPIDIDFERESREVRSFQ